MKGKNGIQEGLETIETFLKWSESVTDWKPFVRQGILNISRIARESELERNVFYTNTDLRDVHFPALESRLENDGVLRARVASPTLLVRPKRDGMMSDARVKQIQEEAEAVKAENRELRRQLERLKGIDEILHSTGRVPW